MQAGATPVTMLAAELVSALHGAGITTSQASGSGQIVFTQSPGNPAQGGPTPPAPPPLPAIALELRSLLNRDDKNRSTLPKTETALLALEVRRMVNDGGTSMFPPRRPQGPYLGKAGEAVRRFAQIEKEKQERERLRRSNLPHFYLGPAGEAVARAAREKAARDAARNQGSNDGVIFASRRSFLDEPKS